MGRDDDNGASAAPPPSKRDRHKSISDSEPDPDSDSDNDESSRKSHRSSSSRRRSTSRDRKRTKTLTSGSSKRRRSRDSSNDSYTSSDSESYDSESDSDSRRRRRKERKRKEEKRRREKDKEKKRKRDKEKRKRKEKEKKKKDKGKKGAVTGSWGKYGIIKETDMWNKRPEFTAWLLEVKKVNIESLPNWEEKQLFKDFMEDHNTATFPSKKYYNLDAYHERKMVKDMKKGIAMVQPSERTIFNDEEIRRLEMQREREKQKEQEVEALKRSMQSGMAQAMKEQAQLREEMAYQYKLGNFEAAAAIQRRLDPDVPT